MLNFRPYLMCTIVLVLSLVQWALSAPAPLVRQHRAEFYHPWPVGHWEGQTRPDTKDGVEVRFYSDNQYWERWNGSTYVGTWKLSSYSEVQVECDQMGGPGGLARQPNHYSLRFERTDMNGLEWTWGRDMRRVK